MLVVTMLHEKVDNGRRGLSSDTIQLHELIQAAELVLYSEITDTL
jgi:hypothetical protein